MYHRQRHTEVEEPENQYCVDNTSPCVETWFGKFPVESPLAYHGNILYTYIQNTNEDFTNCILFPTPY